MNLKVQSFLQRGMESVVLKHTEPKIGQKILPNLAMIEAMNADFDVLKRQTEDKFKIPHIFWSFRAKLSGAGNTILEIAPVVLN